MMAETHKQKLKRVRDNDAKHDKEMSEIVKRGGITLGQLRAMSMLRKDAFITKHRNAQ